MRRLGNVAVQSQFATFRHDCTVDALEMALHTVAPGRVPVTPGALDALVRAAVAAGETRDAQGAMTAADLAWLCAHEGAPCTQVVGVAAGMAAIRRWGGIKPLVVQVLHGWALPGNEPGVDGHAVACFGYDPLADVCELGNGDSARGRAGLTDVVPLTGSGSIEAAAPFCVTVIELTGAAAGGAGDGGGGGQAAVGYTVNGDGTVTFGNGVRLRPGMSAEVQQRGAPRADDQPAGAEYDVGADLAALEWQSGAVWSWRHARPVVNRDAGAEVAAALRGVADAGAAQVAAARQQVTLLQGQIATVQAQLTETQNALTETQNALTETQSALAAVRSVPAAEAALVAKAALVDQISALLSAAGVQAGGAPAAAVAPGGAAAAVAPGGAAAAVAPGGAVAVAPGGAVAAPAV